MDRLRQYHWTTKKMEERPEVKARVIEGQNIYSDVAVHPKGSAGSSRSMDARPALTLTFDKFVSGQHFHGLSKISLNNSVQDPTYLREELCREIMNDLDVPTPRGGHALVTINGAFKGLYVVLEGADKKFLKRHFGNGSGTLYDGGYIQDVDKPLDITSGNKRGERGDLRRLAAAARDPNPANRFEGVAKLIDMDRFEKMLAIEAIVVHWDSYDQNRNNYRIYHDPSTDKLVFIPHGMDLTYGGDRIRNSLFPQMIGVAARAVMIAPEERRRHLERVREYYTHTLNPESILARVSRLEQSVASAVAEVERERIRGGLPASQSEPSLADFTQAMAELRELIQLRSRLVGKELTEMGNSPPEPGILAIAPGSEPATLQGWMPRYDEIHERGRGWIFDEVQKDGRKSLHINLAPGGGRVSWRTHTLLPAGQYRFGGEFQTSSINGGQTCRVRIRISGDERAPFLTGPDIWQKGGTQIDVLPEDAPKPVEFVCEVIGNIGEAWFDEDSLRVVRLR
jgi:hypothetical protein